jgi:hypothetical protein
MIGDSVSSHFRISELDQPEYWEKQKPQQDRHPAEILRQYEPSSEGLPIATKNEPSAMRIKTDHAITRGRLFFANTVTDIISTLIGGDYY